MVAELLLLLRIMGLPTAEGKQEGSDGGRSGGLETAKASQAGGVIRRSWHGFAFLLRLNIFNL